MSGAVGSPWPNGAYGEVVSPSGRRAYLAGQAAALARRTQRWATDLASREGSPVESERGHIIGRKGTASWFLIADSFERYLKTTGNWPPRTSEPSQDLEQLLLLQGADLEASRRREQHLQATIDRLLHDRDELLATIESLSQVVAALSRTAKAPPPPPEHGVLPDVSSQ
ncbi:hypothetical protein Mycch_5364 (plasmid) [Mycolicibacterium chubuense NBB4]|uniref:Uncharacterized protein n=1 Tax=Mycolicibacterium chubuense (strain NBB4) TaxID=710421 RepID=I4BRY4_MYCCN|nr:hypothetical protein [Mycolicibacterium chubuense]AFM20041.1 hypothetical protein Mycch_5364 [Mycolicibacterium chubuense NBB4]